MSRALAALLPKLAPIIARMCSDHDGERLACISAIERLLAAQQLKFVDLAAFLAGLPPEPRRSAKHGGKREPVSNQLLNGLREVIESRVASGREIEFAAGLLQHAFRYAGLTARQLEAANDVIYRVRRRAERTTA